MPLITFPSVPPFGALAINPETALAVRPNISPNPNDSDVMLTAGRNAVVLMPPEQVANQLGGDFRRMQEVTTLGPSPVYLNRRLVNEVVPNGASVCFVFVGGVKFAVAGDLTAVVAAL